MTDFVDRIGKKYLQQAEKESKICTRQIQKWISEIGPNPISGHIGYPIYNGRYITLSDMQLQIIKEELQKHYSCPVIELKCWTEADPDVYGTNHYASIEFDLRTESQLQDEIDQYQEKINLLKEDIKRCRKV